MAQCLITGTALLSTRCYIPGDSTLHNHRCENLQIKQILSLENDGEGER
jgi:hypothetical protein